MYKVGDRVVPKSGDNLSRFKKLSEESVVRYKEKDKLYGSSFGKSVQKYGIISALTRMSDKWNRIENLILNELEGSDDERLIDSLMDLSDYCKMTVIEIEKKNGAGE